MVNLLVFDLALDLSVKNSFRIDDFIDRTDSKYNNCTE